MSQILVVYIEKYPSSNDCGPPTIASTSILGSLACYSKGKQFCHVFGLATDAQSPQDWNPKVMLSPNLGFVSWSFVLAYLATTEISPMTK